MSGAPPLEWSCDLLESDRRYFEADAEVIPITGAVIARLHGGEQLASGCVVQRIDPAGVPEDGDAWLAGIEERLRAFRCPRARLYLDRPHEVLERALSRRGYRGRVEFGLARAADATEGTGTTELRAAADAAGWLERRKLMERSRLAPDGHRADPDLWVEMERRKYDAGYMRPYLIVSAGRIAGALSTAPCGRLLRLKNLIIDPAHRRRGVATAAAAQAARLAADGGLAAAGCFVLEGEPGIAAYIRSGYHHVTRQTEWVRELGATK